MILIIAEKPSVAKDIAAVAGANKKEKGYYSGAGYYVSWCLGHLVQLAPPEAYDPSLKAWRMDALPIVPDKYKTVVSEATKSQFNILKTLMHRSDVTELIEATDAGREGELIFRLVYEKAGCKKPFKRLWISSMEDKAIREGLANLRPGSEYDSLYDAALCRQRADWLVGINLTRFYTKRYDVKYNVGRVQTPTVNMIVSRQREIENFVPLPYYVVTADLGGFGVSTKVDEKRAADEITARCAGRDAFLSKLEQKEKQDRPPALYDLTTLQREANRYLGYSARQTLDYLQSLYQAKLATYPRTDSRYITGDMEDSTKALIKGLVEDTLSGTLRAGYDLGRVSVAQIINDKKVSDHHALLPTANVTKNTFETLPTGESNILLLIIFRLLSAVYGPQKYRETKAVFDIAGEPFTVTGREILDAGYKPFEAQVRAFVKKNGAKEDSPEEEKPDGSSLPSMSEGDTFQVLGMKTETKQTKPPVPYTEDTLLHAMETAGRTLANDELRAAISGHGIGTPATRDTIIEGAIKNGYVERKGNKLLPTEKANTFIDLVADMVKDPAMTAEWEKQLEAVKAGDCTAGVFMQSITDSLCSFINDSKLLM